MKILIVLAAIFLAGCSTTSVDWRSGDMNGFAGSVPYELDVDDMELQFRLREHNGENFRGNHNLFFEQDSVRYGFKYRF